MWLSNETSTIIGVKKGHRGKHLVTKMVAAYEEVAVAKGFEHSICWASNARTGSVLQKKGYEIASELNIHELKDGEEQVLSFAEVEDEHKLNRFWIKRLAKSEQKNEKWMAMIDTSKIKYYFRKYQKSKAMNIHYLFILALQKLKIRKIYFLRGFLT